MIFLELISVFSVAFSRKIFSLLFLAAFLVLSLHGLVDTTLTQVFVNSWRAAKQGDFHQLAWQLFCTSLRNRGYQHQTPFWSAFDICGLKCTLRGCYSRRIIAELYRGDATFLMLLSILFFLPHYICKTASLFAYYLCILPHQNIQHLSDEQLMSDCAYGKDVVIPLWTLCWVAVLSFYLAVVVVFFFLSLSPHFDFSWNLFFSPGLP